MAVAAANYERALLSQADRTPVALMSVKLIRQGKTPLNRQIAPNERIYAIGVVDGRLDLLGELIGLIRQDSAERGKASTTIIQLGNLVGRSPASAELVAKFMKYTKLSSEVVVLKGRHEAMMAEALGGNLMLFGLWLQLGGDAVLASWGVDRQVIASRHLPDLLRAALLVIPRDALNWLKRLPSTYSSGDYDFVHAAGQPGSSSGRRDKDRVCLGGDAIGEKDPNVLVAVGLEKTARWTLRTGPDVGGTVQSLRIGRRQAMIFRQLAISGRPAIARQSTMDSL